jgi:DNA-directed RNA polymerase subunit RPC12/RpoP
MEWRCAWCGKPHETDDPPCDECGHDTFEQAVVQRTEVDSTVAWVCTECGREHPKHNPPCSRCGNQTLERRDITVDDAELAAPGYRDLLTPRYVAALVAVVVLGGVLVLGLAGVVNVPGLNPGVPAVADVPGNATHLGDVPLDAVENAYLQRANLLRPEANLTLLHRNDRLGAVAVYHNQRRVKAAAGDGSLPSREELGDLIDGPCGREAGFVAETVPIPASVETPDAIGGRLAERAFESGQLGFSAPRGRVGLDLHALENRAVSVTLFAC